LLRKPYKVLITGGTGFIGKSLVKKILSDSKLEKKYLEIDIISRQTINIKNEINSKENYVTLNYFKDNINTLNSLPSKKYDYVIHAASPSSEERFRNSLSKIDRFNAVLIGSHNIFSLSNEYKFNNFLLLSSAAIYASNINEPINEESCNYSKTDDHFSFYAEAKRASETMALLYSEKNKFTFNIARIFSIIGPGMYLHEDSGYIISNFIRASYFNKPLEIKGNAGSVRSFLDIDDAVNFIRLLMRSNTKNEIINLGSNEKLNLKDLAKKFNTILNKKNKIIYGERVKRDFMFPDISKAKKILNWHPKITLDQSIIKIYEEYCKSPI